jgi:hypothetical protein
MSFTVLGRYSALAVSIWACVAGAQTPAGKPAAVEDRGNPGGTQMRQQQRASAAYRTLEQTRYERKLAEQDYVNAEEAHRAAEQRAAALKNELAKMAKARDAARGREAAAAKAYDAALNAGGAR